MGCWNKPGLSLLFTSSLPLLTIPHCCSHGNTICQVWRIGFLQDRWAQHCTSRGRHSSFASILHLHLLLSLHPKPFFFASLYSCSSFSSANLPMLRVGLNSLPSSLFLWGFDFIIWKAHHVETSLYLWMNLLYLISQTCFTIVPVSLCLPVSYTPCLYCIRCLLITLLLRTKLQSPTLVQLLVQEMYNLRPTTTISPHTMKCCCFSLWDPLFLWLFCWKLIRDVHAYKHTY